MRQFVAFAGLGLAMLLGACVQKPAEPQPEPSAALPSFQRAAYAGSRQRLDFLTTLKPDCSYMGPSTYHFPNRPQHGVVDFKQSDEPPTYLQNSIYYKCNDRNVHGVVLYYTPDRGYGGVDHFVMEWIAPSGMLYRRQYEVTVK